MLPVDQEQVSAGTKRNIRYLAGECQRMSLKGKEIKMSDGHRLSEETLGRFVGRELEKLSRANVWGGYHTLPMTKTSEGILGLDEAVWWKDDRSVFLNPWFQKSGGYYHPPILLQYKIPDCTEEDFKYTLPRDQFARMRLLEHLNHSPFYALSLVDRFSELDRGKDNLQKILALVLPSELGITDLAYEEYLVRINKKSGELQTTPVQSALGKEPFHIHPKEMMSKIIAEMERLGIPRRWNARDPDWGMLNFKMKNNYSNLCFCDN